MAEINIDQDIFKLLEQAPDGGPIGDDESDRRTEAIEQLTTLLTWGAESIQEVCDETGYPGFGKMKPDQVAKLGSIVAQRKASGFIVENSPELTLGLLLMGIGVSNFMHYRKQQLANHGKDDEDIRRESRENGDRK